MANALVHDVCVEDARTFETATGLRRILTGMLGGNDCDFDDTYVVELLAETLSDRSVAHSIRIRKAEPV